MGMGAVREYKADGHQKNDGQEINEGKVHEDSVGQENAAKAGVTALNAGVDLILIAHDYDLYLEMMKEAQRAQAAGEVDMEMLEKSQVRLEKLQEFILNTTNFAVPG